MSHDVCDVTGRFQQRCCRHCVHLQSRRTPLKCVFKNSYCLESEDKVESEKSDIIYITGNKHKCEAAKQALLESVPIAEEVDVPFKFHRYLIGQKGEEIRRFMKTYEVNVSIPQADQQSDIVTVSKSY